MKQKGKESGEGQEDNMAGDFKKGKKEKSRYIFRMQKTVTNHSEDPDTNSPCIFKLLGRKEINPIGLQSGYCCSNQETWVYINEICSPLHEDLGPLF